MSSENRSEQPGFASLPTLFTQQPSEQWRQFPTAPATNPNWSKACPNENRQHGSHPYNRHNHLNSVHIDSSQDNHKRFVQYTPQNNQSVAKRGGKRGKVSARHDKPPKQQEKSQGKQEDYEISYDGAVESPSKPIVLVDSDSESVAPEAISAAVSNQRSDLQASNENEDQDDILAKKEALVESLVQKLTAAVEESEERQHADTVITNADDEEEERVVNNEQESLDNSRDEFGTVRELDERIEKLRKRWNSMQNEVLGEEEYFDQVQARLESRHKTAKDVAKSMEEIRKKIDSFYHLMLKNQEILIENQKQIANMSKEASVRSAAFVEKRKSLANAELELSRLESKRLALINSERGSSYPSSSRTSCTPTESHRHRLSSSSSAVVEVVSRSPSETEITPAPTSAAAFIQTPAFLPPLNMHDPNLFAYHSYMMMSLNQAMMSGNFPPTQPPFPSLHGPNQYPHSVPLFNFHPHNNSRQHHPN